MEFVCTFEAFLISLSSDSPIFLPSIQHTKTAYYVYKSQWFKKFHTFQIFECPLEKNKKTHRGGIEVDSDFNPAGFGDLEVKWWKKKKKKLADIFFVNLPTCMLFCQNTRNLQYFLFSWNSSYFFLKFPITGTLQRTLWKLRRKCRKIDSDHRNDISIDFSTTFLFFRTQKN